MSSLLYYYPNRPILIPPDSKNPLNPKPDYINGLEKLLVGKTWGDARHILEDQEYGKHVILSRIWKKGFWDLFQQADGEIIEGIILKNPKGKLVISASKIKDVPWMMKIRKPCKKYSF